MNKTDRIRIEHATVKMENKGGQGVLVPGNYFITATHVVEVIYTGMAVLCQPHVELAKAGVADLVMQICAAEAFQDIAVLEKPDNQVFFDEADAYNAFCEQTPPVPVCLTALKSNVQYRLHLYTHEHKWLQGTGYVYGRPPHRFIRATFPESIKAGTSGSPIVNDKGELVSIVSTTDSGSQPVVAEVLPVWLLKKIRAAQKEIGL